MNLMKLEEATTLKLIDKLLQDPLLLRRLGDRIYQLIQDDQWSQYDRDRNYYRFKE